MVLAEDDNNNSEDEGVASGSGSDLGDSDPCETGDQLLHSYLYHRYVHVRDRALAERAALGRGHSPLMRSLYNFWVERLQHKFNRNMFAHFKELALEDAASGDRHGMECLFIFLRRSLSIIYRERLFREFIALVTDEFQEETFGLEMLSLFLDERSPEVAIESHATVQKRIFANPELAAALRMLSSLRRLCLE
eukprot:m.52446 g.52446  ORF g.52446 m.52446 type:complete len:193 (+) comp13074_c0_seq2:587-1165(+)